MSKPDLRSNNITLGDDGELHQILDDPATRRDAIFCVHCSTPNLADAQFCNRCGQSLLDQQADARILEDSDESKTKRDQSRKPELATYDPNRFSLIEKRPKSVISTVLACIIVLILAYVFSQMPAAIVFPILMITVIIGLLVCLLVLPAWYGRGR